MQCQRGSDTPDYKDIDTSNMPEWSATIIKRTAPLQVIEMIKKMKEKTEAVI